ncbi:MAG TPA: ATP-dependent zinc protease [Nannocystis exedens]|nr:ATP-dependent zinc protease [Nannocystis exedens]
MRGPSRVLPVIGWREWVVLPELAIPAIKAKIDTGARTSALHAVNLERFRRRGKPWVRFEVHPHQRDLDNSVSAQAVVIDERAIRNSGGLAEYRPVILARVDVGDVILRIELTLTNRSLMGFRMLLGREALRNRFCVDPGASFCYREVGQETSPGPPLRAKAASSKSKSKRTRRRANRRGPKTSKKRSS